MVSTANSARRLADSIQSTYVLNVSATDGVYSAFTQVKVGDIHILFNTNADVS